MNLTAHIWAGEWAVSNYPPSLLREACRRLGESDTDLNLRLMGAGWPANLIFEALRPGSASLVRAAVRNIAREIRKLGKTDGDGNPIVPNWDLVALSLWRAMDRWVTDSTKSASFFKRLWKKITLMDSYNPVTEVTGAASAGGYERPVGMQRARLNRVSMAELRALFPDADESFLRQLLKTYGGSGSDSLTSSREIGSSSGRTSMESRSSSLCGKGN